MASLRPTIPHLRIPHSIGEALMTSDFTKRQKKIIDLILRLSWGCGKDSATIPRYRDFEVLGIAETHIGKELSGLVESKVIFIKGDKYSFNKNYDQWQVSRVKASMSDRLTELVRLNLNHNYQNGRYSKTEHAKTVSENLPKHEVSAYRKGRFSTTKSDSCKKILNKNKDYTCLDIESLFQPEVAFETWQVVLHKLKSQVSDTNYRIWLKDTKGLGYMDSCFIVGVANSSMAEYLNENQRSLVKKTLIEVGEHNPEVHFVIGEKNIAAFHTGTGYGHHNR